MKKLYTSDDELVICECGGEFIFEDMVFLTKPPQYPYHCNQCGKRKVRRADNSIYDW